MDRFRPDAPFRQPQPRGQVNAPASIPRLLSLIEKACRPTMQEPDLALNLQIADMINEKKDSAPREAANAIVKLINSKQTSTAILAMSVLDVCVKNCGFPFHLQISRKDFLNNLVRRFPEKPPMNYSRIQLLILEAIQEWRETICRTSKYRNDLGYIRDMHRLLTYKGYVFPDINRDDAAVLNAPDTLKSAAELEQEDRDAQSAKLHELLHSGTPKDLEEANKIMKLLAGFKEQSTDYKATVAKELDKIRRKAEILEEMLSTVGPSDKLDNSDVFSDLVQELKQALPKLVKIQQDEESADPESAERVSELANYVNALVQKYDLISKGDFTSASNVPMTSLASGNLANTSRKGLIESLIDLDDGNATPATSSEPHASDLLGLDFGGLSLGGGSSSANSVPAAAAASTSSNVLDLFGTSGANTPAPAPVSPTAGNDFLGLSTPSPSPASPAPVASADGKTVSVFQDETVKIDFVVSRTQSTNLSIRFSNPSAKKITNLRFELASTRNRPLSVGTISGSSIEPGQQGGIVQKATIQGTDPVKLRWRLTFKSGLSDVAQSGTQTNL